MEDFVKLRFLSCGRIHGAATIPVEGSTGVARQVNLLGRVMQAVGTVLMA
jgi:hypothetical protein